MNQRIDILIEKARGEINEQFGLSDAYNVLVMIRLVELTVKECADTCSSGLAAREILNHFKM